MGVAGKAGGWGGWGVEPLEWGDGRLCTRIGERKNGGLIEFGGGLSFKIFY